MSNEKYLVGIRDNKVSFLSDDISAKEKQRAINMGCESIITVDADSDAHKFYRDHVKVEIVRLIND